MVPNILYYILAIKKSIFLHNMHSS